MMLMLWREALQRSVSAGIQNSCSRISRPITAESTRVIRLLYLNMDVSGSLLNRRLQVSPGAMARGVASYNVTIAPEMEIFMTAPLYRESAQYKRHFSAHAILW
jgi:hypothetical protein